MKFAMHSLTTRAAYTVLFGATLAACGGNNPADQAATVSTDSQGTLLLASKSGYVPQSRGTTTPSTPNTTAPVAGSSITNIRFESTASANQTNVPVTFGQVFAPGDLSSTSSLAGVLDSGATIPLQVDVKAKHADGSVRHAVISAVLPTLNAGEVRTMSLNRSTAGTSTALAATALTNAGFTASFSALVDGVRYTASADQLIKAGKATVWLSGANANEWHVSAPLTDSNGVAHPHLSARFAIRWYQAVKKARVDVTVENNWAYEAAPRNFTYDASLTVGGQTAYAKAGMTHLHHARWRKLAWWGGAAPEVNVKHNSVYLINSRAVPNYDQTLSVPESALAALKTRWTGPQTEPMGVGLANPYMPSTGGRPDIGLMPGWSATYLLSMDKRAKEVTMGTADLAGSFSMHYRDRKTDRPVSVVDYPYMTIFGNPGDTWNKATNQYESFPVCASSGACNSPNVHDTPHQPALAYLPYLVSGDYYYLEELQFWAMYNSFMSNPYYRGFGKGLLSPDQVRGQAWSMRTLGEVAYITPDADPLKAQFVGILDNNLEYYNTTYPQNPSANTLGVLTNGNAYAYGAATGIAPWQDDFFTSAVGHVAELGFDKAKSILAYKVMFPTMRMVGSGACWIDAAKYEMQIRDSASSANYTTMAQVYKVNHADAFSALGCGSSAMASSLGLMVGEMTGYSSATDGYPSNMQPALAYAATAGGTAGAQAWTIFQNRANKPNYATSPQFAVVPRK
jgi:hypothetical protein